MPSDPPPATPGDADLDPRAADRARATAIANARDAPRKIDVHWMTSELIAAWNRLDMLTAELARLTEALAATEALRAVAETEYEAYLAECLELRAIVAGGAGEIARLTADLARRDAALAALASWGRARRREAVAIQASFAANHRGPAWFARCVAGEQRADAEHDLFAAWEAYAAATGAGREEG
jgi:uncharacterized small protein (DUF1192 family)